MTEGQTADGLLRLRERFVRRGEYLLRDTHFLEAIRSAQKYWRGAYPEYPIAADRKRWTDHPPSLLAAIAAEEESERAEQQRAKEAGEWIIGGYGARNVGARWSELVASLANHFWPRSDFPHPYPWDRHPAAGFVTAVLFLTDPTDPIRDVGRLIPPFVLEPEPMLAERGERVLEDRDPRDAVGWCLPLYPGITAHDLEEAAARIADRVRQIYQAETVNARMLSLREQGLTHQVIADRLGLDLKTVSAKLKGVPRGGAGDS